jgi:hypothetical protein
VEQIDLAPQAACFDSSLTSVVHSLQLKAFRFIPLVNNLSVFTTPPNQSK